MADVTITQDEYAAVVELARRGATTPDMRRDIDAFFEGIEKKNGITRHRLWIQWQEADSPPPKAAFPESWPPQLRHYVELLSRPIAKVDVETLLKQKARKPVSVMVTTDPGAVLGWSPYEQFFVR